MNEIDINNLTSDSRLVNDLKQIQSGKFKRQRILGKWKNNIKESPQKQFEYELFCVLIKLFGKLNLNNDEEIKFLLAYLQMINSEKKFEPDRSIILEFHNYLINIINTYLQKEKTENNNKIIEELFNIYFYYPLRTFDKGYNPLYDEITKEVSLLIPNFIKKYPEDIGSLVLNIFKEYHLNAIKEYEKLLSFYLKNLNHIEYFSLLNEMFSTYNDKDEIFCKNSVEITKNVIKSFDFQDENIKFLCNQILICLGVDSKEERNKALKYCIKSKSTKKSIELILNIFKNSDKVEDLKSFYDEIVSKQNAPKKYHMNKQANIKFNDFNFKLLIVQELMYNQEVLKPKMILNDFIEEYDKREISEKDGYKIIPEIKKYFNTLDIDDSLLAKIKRLDIDFEYGGMIDVLENMWPFWDPGLGDEILHISNKAIDDIKLLPNLKEIIGINLTKINKKNQNILKEKNIILVENQE